VILFALVNGYLDDVPVEDVTRLEAEFLNWLEANDKDLLNNIAQTKQW